MKKFLIAAVLSLSFGLNAANDCIIKTLPDGKDMTADSIEADDSGNLTYKTGSIQSKIRKGQYEYAWIPKPKELNDADKLLADKKFKEAQSAFGSAYKKYQFLGWDIYALTGEAKAIMSQGDKKAAIEKLKAIKDLKVSNPKQENDLLNGFKVLAGLYIETADYKSAEPILDDMSKSGNDVLAAFAFNAKGDMLQKQGHKKDAVIAYMQTALIFDKSNPERPEALFKAAKLLDEMGDKRSVKFAEKLKTEYPDNSFAKQLK